MNKKQPNDNAARPGPGGRAGAGRWSGRAGSIQPLIVLGMLVVFLFGLILLERERDAVRHSQGLAVARAVALDGLRALHAPEYVSAGMQTIGTEDLMERLRRVAAANGLTGKTFFELSEHDVSLGPTWLSVTVRSREPGVQPATAVAVGRPAGKIRAGRVEWNDEGAVRSVAGCLPLGVQQAHLPYSGEPLPVTLPLSGPEAAAGFVGLPGAEAGPVAYVRFLAGRSGEGVAAPPAVTVGDRVELLEPAPEYLAALRGLLRERVVIVAYLDGDEVVGFGRVLLKDVRDEPAALDVVLAPSAVAVSVTGDRKARFAKDLAQADVSPCGLALRMQLEGMEW